MGAALGLLFGLFKFGKIGGTILTMLVALAVYTSIFGWQYAAGFIALIFVHEMGHFLAAKQRSLAVSAPTFIPFVGAWIELKDQPMDA
jgi:Zn-dependent protease